MVLAAGRGSRLKPFTTKFQKVMMPILGVPCIEFPLLRLRDAGIQEVVINIHAHSEQVLAYLKTNPVPELKFHISDETRELLGSAGGFRKALPHFGSESFFYLHGDVLNQTNLEALEARHQELKRKHGVLMTLTLARGKTLKSQLEAYREIFVEEASGLICGFGEIKKQIPFYTGAAVFEPGAFLHLPYDRPAEFVPEVLEPLIEQGKVGFFWMEDSWLDIGSPETWWKAHFDLQKMDQAKQLPASWSKSIHDHQSGFVLDLQKNSVDYSPNDAHPLGKNAIRLEDMTYALSSVGN
jgi:NDP-sugar pyrophosphorylase family protein